jgi:uncharacterized protein
MPSWLSPMIAEGISPALALVLIALGVVVTGIAKSGFGGGIGVLSVPLLAAAMSADKALGVMLPVLLAADVFAVWQHRRDASRFHLKWSLVGAVAGVLVGGAILMWFARGDDPAAASRRLAVALKYCVSIIALLMVAVQVFRLLGGKLPRVPDVPSSGVAFGALAGVTSTLAHAAGPVMSAYLLEQRLSKAKLVGTMVLFFFVLNLIKVPVFVGQSLITVATLKASALLALLVPAGSLLGLWMHRHVPEKPFTVVMYAATAVTAGYMLLS